MTTVSGDQEREFAWKRKGKGNGLRWLILRDLTAGLANYPMTQEQAEDFMIVLRGISWAKTRAMCEELARLGAIEKIKEEHAWFWRATDKGVAIFVGKRSAIPARIAQAVLTTTTVSVGVIGGTNREF